MYVSITGLRVKRWWLMPVFWRHAVPTFKDAQNAKGNIHSAVRRIGRVHHTLTVWDSRADMLAYLRSARHAYAMRRFSSFATGRVYGYEAEVPPDWDAALAQYHAHGRDIGP
ncbi:hypothetical protein ACERZ8_16580 [Tateyamaria armeniaca]|uniref:DUF3291 domain-containing protein n=1 Tax=Tateyamaria armeniaca TaxID=2518930 RepID=A0ABW8UWW1_9RHOB